MDLSSLALNIATLVISFAALLVSRKAQRAADRANEPNIRFHLICHSFDSKVADVELVTSNLSNRTNALVKTRVALMDGPPAAMTLRFKSADGSERESRAKAGVEFPPEISFEVEPLDPDRPIQSVGAKLARCEFEPPLNIPGSSSVGRRLIFELPQKLPEHAFDSLRVWVQARDSQGRLWEQMLVLSEG